MKNILKKEDNTGLIITLAISIATGGALAYLFLTESGSEVIRSVKQKLKEEAKDLASGIISNKTGIKKMTVRRFADHIVK